MHLKFNMLSVFRYEIMLSCWAHFPEDRPNFKKLHEILTAMNSDGNPYVNFEALERLTLPPMKEEVNGKMILSSFYMHAQA